MAMQNQIDGPDGDLGMELPPPMDRRNVDFWEGVGCSRQEPGCKTDRPVYSIGGLMLSQWAEATKNGHPAAGA